jgi:hypothetical protein
LTLAVAVIESAFRALLMPAVGTAPLLSSGVVAASLAAIAVSTIAVLTNQEHRLAIQAQPLPQNRFAMRRHASWQAGLDNGNALVAL